MKDIRALEGRCALVTGSTAGIGLEAARSLASMGCDLVLHGFGDPEAIASLCASLAEEHSVRVIHEGTDLSRVERVQAMIDTARQHGGGRLDILVNNAGFTLDAPVETIQPHDWDRLLAVNLTAPFHAIRCALPGMREHGWGRIVNVASVHGLVGMANRGAYVAAKHGLLGLTKVVALETAGTPITCNAVCPGLVGTDRVIEAHRQLARDRSQSFDEVQREALTTRQPSGKYIPPAEVAAAIAFLCGPHATEVRGAAWALDGGWSAR